MKKWRRWKQSKIRIFATSVLFQAGLSINIQIVGNCDDFSTSKNGTILPAQEIYRLQQSFRHFREVSAELMEILKKSHRL